MVQSLKNRLKNYLRKVWFIDNNIWIPKGKLEDLSKSAGYLGDNGDVFNELKKEKRSGLLAI